MKHTYLEHLSKDPIFKEIISNSNPKELILQDNHEFFLYRSVINQQLSTKVGAIILERFLNIFEGNIPTASQILLTPNERLRSIGLSVSKISYLKNIAEFVEAKGLNRDELQQLENEEVLKILTGIKGIGPWTAQNFLMMALGREDVFSADDLILQNVVAELYDLKKENKKDFKRRLLEIASTWSPYRTYASLHLWEFNSVRSREKKKRNAL